MTKRAPKSTRVVPTAFPWKRAKRLLAWALAPAYWPEKYRAPRREAHLEWKAIRKARILLESTAGRNPHSAITLPTRLLQELHDAEKNRIFQKELFYAKTSHSYLAMRPGDLILEVQRRIFLAKLIFEKLRESEAYRKLLYPKKDALRDIEIYWQKKELTIKLQEWVMRNLYRRRTGSLIKIYEWLNKNFSRYKRRKGEFDPAAVIELLHGDYLRDKRMHTTPGPEERRMFQDLARLAPAITQQRPHLTIHRAPWWQMKIISDIPLPNITMKKN